jgi:membrane protein YqaA with SNARE-associated domain
MKLHAGFEHQKKAMITGHIIAVLLPMAARSMRRWLFHLGGIGLIPLGLLDNSLIPLPGILDAAAIVLSSRQEQLWLYYGLMAAAGSVAGGFVTYRLARKGGKEALDRRFSRRKVNRVCEIFGRWGFAAIAIPALLPPPVPMIPFLLAAGAMQYPPRRFLAALTLGRISRYLILAYFAARYGRQIIALIAKHGHPVVVTILLIVIATASVVFYFWRGSKNKDRYGRLAIVSAGKSNPLVVQDNAQQGIVYVEPAIVIDESQLLEFVHEKIDA